MAEVPELYDIVKERYNAFAKSALEEYIEELDALWLSMKESLKLNHERWYGEYDEDLTDKNVKFLKDFLIARKAQLDTLWALD